MPLINITTHLDAQVGKLERPREMTSLRHIVRKQLGPALPELLVAQKEKLGLGDTTPSDAAQIKFFDHDLDDINVTDVWVEVQFSEEITDSKFGWKIARDTFHDIFLQWFFNNGYHTPDSIALDIKWGPMHGVVMINGGYIEY